ncbi:hypothetical protein [Actinoallomurus acaciae]|uniref:Integrase n=1 Tax=Actinoallomurus acaciae TaxID=502577 RepID=A0ABV5YJV2_9ACTN
MLANGASIEPISRLVGHGSMVVTESVYRHGPVITEGAENIGKAFARSRPGLGLFPIESVEPDVA